MKKIITTIIALVWTTATAAVELTFQFNSPAFSGIGYSSHALTFE
jgi:hypothetical protein